MPIGAVALRARTFDALFNSMVRAPVHGSTFAKNNLAMAAGLATLSVIVEEDLVARAARLGEGLLDDLRALVPEFEFLHEVRGKGMLQALVFGPPRSLKLRAAWSLLERATPGLFCQMVTIPLFKEHRILCQTAGHDQNVVKFLPPLTLTPEDCSWILGAVRAGGGRHPPRAGLRVGPGQDAGRSRVPVEGAIEVRCLVTGANGFVGSALVRELLASGYEVRAGVGAEPGLENLEGLPVELAPIELLDRASLEQAARGCDAIFHTAAIYSFWEKDPEQIYRVNVEGTRALLEAARGAGVRRVVHTSSTATLTPAFDAAGSVGTEDDVFDARSFQGHYKHSKVMAETLALRAAASGLPVTIVHPTTVLGHGDRRPTPTGGMVVHFLQGRMKAYADTVLNLVDVEDVARGHRLALEKGRPGERYILGGENVSMARLVEVLSELTGMPGTRVRLPPRVVTALGGVGEWWADHVSGRSPMVDRESALHAIANRAFSNEKAVRELGFSPAGARRTVARAVAWFLELGAIPPERARVIEARGALTRTLAGAG